MSLHLPKTCLEITTLSPASAEIGILSCISAFLGVADVTLPKVLPVPIFIIKASFVFIGQMIWLLFSQGLRSSANSLVAAGNMLTKINFPREVLVFSAMGQTIFDFLIRVPLLIISVIWVGFFPDFSIFFCFPILVPLVFLTTAAGIWGGLHLGYEWNFNKLEPKGLRSVELQDEIIDKFKFAISISLLTANSVEESRELRKQFKGKRLVGEVDDISLWISRPDFEKSKPFIIQVLN